MSKTRGFKAILNFKGKRARYDKSYVQGRIFQMAKSICTNEDGTENIVRLGPWKMKHGQMIEYALSVRTSEAKFFEFLETVEKAYPGLVSEFDVSKKRK